MKLTFENLGPIKKGEVDLDKKLNVICGPNNSGKTYLSYDIYGIKTLFLQDESIQKRIKDTFQSISENTTISLDLDKLFNDVIILINEEINSDRYKLTTFGVLNPRNRSLKQELLFDKVFINNKIHILYDWIIEQKNFTVIKEVSNSILQVHVESIGVFIEHLKDYYNVVCNMLLDRNKDTYYYPSDRNGLTMLFQELNYYRLKERVKKIIDEKLKNGTPDSALYPGAIESYLLDLYAVLNLHPNNYQNGERLSQLISQTEKIIKGKIIIDYESKQFLFNPENTDEKLILNEVSSAVKSLLGINVKLQTNSNPKSTFIIDEPELNLHPNNQNLITRFISNLISGEYKVIMASHSDYIIRELNTLIMLGEAKKANKAGWEALGYKFGYDDSELLLAEKVGVYFLNDGGCNAVEVSERGFQIPSIDKIIIEQNNRASEIEYDLYE